MSVQLSNDVVATLRLAHEWATSHIIMIERVMAEFSRIEILNIDGPQRAVRFEVYWDLGEGNIANAEFSIIMTEEFSRSNTVDGKSELSGYFRYKREVHRVEFEGMQVGNPHTFYDHSSIIVGAISLLGKNPEGKDVWSPHILNLLNFIIKDFRKLKKRADKQKEQVQEIIDALDSGVQSQYNELYLELRKVVTHDQSLTFLKTISKIFLDKKIRASDVHEHRKQQKFQCA